MDEIVEPTAPPEPIVKVPLTLMDRMRIARDVFTILGLSIAGVWAIITFWYHASYEPAHEAPIVTPSMTVTPMGEKDGKVAYLAHLVLKNEGRATQNTWGMTFHAFAGKVSSGTLSDGGWRELMTNDTQLEAFHDFREEEPTLIASLVDLMTSPDRNNPILPHAELTWDFHFYVDRATADYLVVTVDVLQPRKDIHAKPEWFTLVRDPGKPVRISQTDACRAAPDCSHFQTNFGRTVSLWR